MIRSWLAERLLDYLALSNLSRGKYRLAQLGSRLLDGAVILSIYGPLLRCRFADSTFWLAARYGNEEVIALLDDLGKLWATVVFAAAESTNPPNRHLCAD